MEGTRMVVSKAKKTTKDKHSGIRILTEQVVYHQNIGKGKKLSHTRHERVKA